MGRRGIGVGFEEGGGEIVNNFLMETRCLVDFSVGEILRKT
jgi:hypothetical protein